MHTLAPPSERAKTAALVLDVVKPGWADLVDIDFFDMSNRSTDIAAHLSLEYTLDYEDPEVFRSLVDFTIMPFEGEDWSQIDDAWCVEIFDRRAVKT